MHTGERPFSCEVYGSAFSQCSNLKLHMCKYSVEIPYFGAVSGSTFSFCSNLKILVQIPYLPTPPLGQDMTRSHFLSGV